MDTRRKVVWSEGMLLTPHHFQQADRYFEDLIADRIRTLWPFGWGVIETDFDHDGLANGRLTLLSLKAVMPDGLVIRIPEDDPPPQTRSFGDLLAQFSDRLSVYLSIPIERVENIDCQLDKDPGARPSRFSAEHIQVIDTTTGENARELLVTKKNLRVLCSGEEITDAVSLKLAEVVRNSSGVISLKETYIPPCLWLTASPYLLRLVRGLTELLVAKRATFSDASRGVLEIVGSDLGKLALVSAIATHLPVLTHLSQVEKVHPVVLYSALAQLAGQLSILGPAQEAAELPPYDHENLSLSFQGLDRRIRAIIERETPTRYVPIPLEAGGENMWVGRVPENRLFVSSQFYALVSGDLSEDQIRTLIPQHVRISSPSKLKELVAAAVPGVRLYHTPKPPTTLPMKSGTQYFRLDDRGALWEEIKKSQVIAIHVPDSLRAIRLQLVATRE